MNPAEIFLESLSSEGLARALLRSFASAEQLWSADRELARDSLLVIARSLPPTVEWRGLAGALEELCRPDQGSAGWSELSSDERLRIQEQLAALNLRATTVAGGWNEELDREYNELMAKLRKK